MKKVLLFLLVLAVSVFALCACEDKNKSNQPGGEVEVEDVTENTSFVSGENTVEDMPKYEVIYNGFGVLTGVNYESIKDKLGQESKPSDTSKACGPFVKGETTHYYYDGVTLDVNYEGVINYISIDSANAKMACGAKVGQTAEEVKSVLTNTYEEDEYSIRVKLGGDFYVDFIKDDDGTISHISVEDMSIEN